MNQGKATDRCRECRVYMGKYKTSHEDPSLCNSCWESEALAALRKKYPYDGNRHVKGRLRRVRAQ